MGNLSIYFNSELLCKKYEFENYFDQVTYKVRQLFIIKRTNTLEVSDEDFKKEIFYTLDDVIPFVET